MNCKIILVQTFKSTQNYFFICRYLETKNRIKKYKISMNCVLIYLCRTCVVCNLYCIQLSENIKIVYTSTIYYIINYTIIHLYAYRYYILCSILIKVNQSQIKDIRPVCCKKFGKIFKSYWLLLIQINNDFKSIWRQL